MEITASEVDVAIVGAGIVGQVLSGCLVREGLTVALVDKQPAVEMPTVRPDVRVVALSHASIRLLESLGVWGEIRANGACPYTKMRVWERKYRDALQFDAHQLGHPNLGFIVENLVLQNVMQEYLFRQDNLHYCVQAPVTSLSVNADNVVLNTAASNQFVAKLVIGADGARSSVREIIGDGQDVHDPDQFAVVAHLSSTQGFQQTAWQRFLPTGTIAFLPTSSHDCVLVWSLPRDTYKKYLEIDALKFARKLDEISEGCFGQLTLSSIRRSFPLKSTHAHHYCDHRLALVGDAAHTVHPLAGQGANLGLLDAAALANTIYAHFSRGRDIGVLANLRAYERNRRLDNELMRRSFDFINQSFRSEAPLTAILRSAAMKLVDQVGPLKSLFIDHALGQRADSPIDKLVRRH